MKTIYKYALDSIDGEIIVPWDSKFLSVQIQNGQPYVWALVDTENNNMHCHYRLVATGEDIEHADSFLAVHEFLGKIQMEGALSLQLVFHVFMEKTKYGK